MNDLDEKKKSQIDVSSENETSSSQPFDEAVENLRRFIESDSIESHSNVRAFNAFDVDYNNKSKRKKDDAKLTDPSSLLGDYHEDRKKLRWTLVWFCLAILSVEIISVFVLVFLQGFGRISLNEWLIGSLFSGVIAQTFGLVYIITNSAFPRQDNHLKEVQSFIEKNGKK